MNHRVSPPATAKGRKAWLYLSILLPALASRVNTEGTSSPNPFEVGSGPFDPRGGNRPYLTSIGPPPLRFMDVLPPPEVSTLLPAGGPPKLPEKNHPADKDVVLPKPVPKAPVAVAKSAAASATSASATSASGPTPPPILPDDVPSQVRPEDFLPYFQYPGSGGRRAAEAQPPAPPLPTSTATYTQDQ